MNYYDGADIHQLYGLENNFWIITIRTGYGIEYPNAIFILQMQFHDFSSGNHEFATVISSYVFNKRVSEHYFTIWANSKEELITALDNDLKKINYLSLGY